MEFLVSILFLIGLFFSTRRSLHSSSEAKPRDSQNGNLVANPRYCGATLQVIHSSLPPLRTVFRELMQGTGAKLLCSLPPTSPSFLHISFFLFSSLLSFHLSSFPLLKRLFFLSVTFFFFFFFFFSVVFTCFHSQNCLYSCLFPHSRSPRHSGTTST